MAAVEVPQWTMGDRMRKARIKAGIGVSEMADTFMCSRGTITNWETDRSKASKRRMEKWAELCGVPLLWIVRGEGYDGPSVIEESSSAWTHWPSDEQLVLPLRWVRPVRPAA